MENCFVALFDCCNSWQFFCLFVCMLLLLFLSEWNVLCDVRYLIKYTVDCSFVLFTTSIRLVSNTFTHRFNAFYAVFAKTHYAFGRWLVVVDWNCLGCCQFVTREMSQWFWGLAVTVLGFMFRNVALNFSFVLLCLWFSFSTKFTEPNRIRYICFKYSGQPFFTLLSDFVRL